MAALKIAQELLNIIYPIGSVYMSTNSASPETLFGGTWTKIQGRFLWATGSTPKTTGGSTTTDSTVLTEAQMPKHYHKSTYWNGPDGSPVCMSYVSGSGDGYDLSWNRVSMSNTTSNLSTSYAGSSQGHTHTFMPPYFEVYMWYRTA